MVLAVAIVASIKTELELSEAYMSITATQTS